MILNRTHITDSETIIKSDRRYPQDAFFKPHGLWYSFNDEWLQRCMQGMRDRIRKYKYTLDIDLSNILIISTIEELTEFNNKYSDEKLMYLFDWNKIAQLYDGIEFRNYNQLCHINKDVFLKTMWIRSLDVSSGCIWNLKCLKSFEKIEVEEKYLKYKE